MEEIISKLLEIEENYGFEIFFDKQRAVALIKDFFTDSKRERKLLEKGIELSIYKKFLNSSVTDILIYKTSLMRELCDEHGLSEEAAEYAVNIWIRLIEEKRGVKIIEQYPVSRKKALNAYKKNLDKPDHVTDEAAVIYDTSKERANREKALSSLKTQTYAIKRSDYTEKNSGAEDIKSDMDKPPFGMMPKIIGNILYQSDEYEEAVNWFRKGAEQGDLIAQNNLAYCYLYGKGVKKNADAATEWFAKAALSGEVAAMVSLGNCYFGGIGVEKDAAKAMPWYIRAAEAGDADAQYILGECFYRGEGVKKSKIEAVKWYEKAAEQRHERAAERLAELKNYGILLHKQTNSEKAPHKNTELHVKNFAAHLFSGIKDGDLFRHIKTFSDYSDLADTIKSKITGLGIKLDNNEYPVFLYNDSGNSILRLSDAVLFATNGVYIHPTMRRIKFLYYADINRMQLDEDIIKRIWLNDFYINCLSLEAESVDRLLRIIKATVKEFR